MSSGGRRRREQSGGRTGRQRRSAPGRLAAYLSGTAFLILWISIALGASGGKALSGDPFRGRELLSGKLCTQCHSVWGHGGTRGPDLPTAVAGKSWPDLVGDFWNHTPRMIDAVGEQGHSWPTLDEREMADLLSYLYYLRLFDEPGSAARGSVAYAQHHCADCHSLAGRGGSRGGALDKYSTYPSPVMLAQAMWNSGPVMQREQLQRGTAIPTFTHNEMADIQAYIRESGLRSDRQIELLPLPGPSRGAAVFEAKRCGNCHRPGGEGPDLASASLTMSVSRMSGILWNHSYAMNDRMQARGIPFPRFKSSEMADLISYLYFLGFLGGEGDPARGASIFEGRGCAACHEGPERQAMDLAGSKAAADSIALSAAMWNHAPEMHKVMAEKGVAWPKFDPGDMGDLAAYLRKLVSAKESKKQ